MDVPVDDGVVDGGLIFGICFGIMCFSIAMMIWYNTIHKRKQQTVIIKTTTMALDKGERLWDKS